jgi:hypothetical protein
MPSPSLTVVHHLYSRPGDLLPACGIVPGPDGRDWHTGHDAQVLLAFSSAGEGCCSLCLQLAADLAGAMAPIIDGLDAVERNDLRRLLAKATSAATPVA